MKANTRRNAITNIIKEKEISTQSELTEELIALGYKTTQATVSRDINEMGLIKIPGETRKFKYAFEIDNSKIDSKVANVFKASIVSIDTSLNLIVIKTVVAAANSVAAIIDTFHIPGILGTISGDDTLLIIAKDIHKVEIIAEKLKEFLL